MRWRWIAALVVVAGVVAIVWPRERAPSKAAVATKPAGKRANTAGKPHDPRALARATVVGTVRDSAQKPILGATVCAVYNDDWSCTQSEAGGRYRLVEVVADDVTLSTSRATFAPDATSVPLLLPGEQRTVDVVLASGGLEVTGVVEDILGGPIASAVVTSDGQRALTDEQGRFSIWFAPTMGIALIEARAAGYGPRSQRLHAPGKIVIALAPDSTIAGTVVDATTGAPIPNARVVADPRGIEATSGADGTFTLDGLAAETYRLEAVAPARYGRLDRALVLGIGERIDGVVVPVHAGRTVVVTLEVVGDRKICNPVPALSDWSFHVPKPWRDEAGRYHFDGLPPSTYTAALGCGATVPPLVVGDDDVEVTWRVETGGVVKGKLAFASDPGRRSSAQIELARAGSLKAPYVQQSSLDDGMYEFRGVPAGTYTLRAMLDRTNGSTPETLTLANGQTLERDLGLDLSHRGRIVGTVLHKGKRVIGAAIRVTAIDGGDVFHGEVRDGKFDIDVPPGRYQVSGFDWKARGDAGLVEVRTREASTVSIDLDSPLRFDEAVAHVEPPKVDIERPFRLGGRVVDANGAPVEGAVVSGIERGTFELEDQPLMRITTNAQGQFSFLAKQDRIYVDVYRIGGGHAKAMLADNEVQTIKLATAGTLTGTVVRGDGTPAARFALRIGEGAAGRTKDFDHTGGRFSIPDPGVYPLVITTMINGVTSSPTTITASSAKTGIVLKLPRTTTITGRIVDGETRKPIADVRINGRQGVDGWAPWFVHSDQVTDADGRFAMRDLPPGPIMLEVTPPTDNWSPQRMTITVPDTNGDVGEFGLAQVRRR